MVIKMFNYYSSHSKMKVELLKLETEHNIFEINNFNISITINYLIPIIVCTFSIK